LRLGCGFGVQSIGGQIAIRHVASACREAGEPQAMIDAMTRKRLQVSTDGGAGPYIMVPVSQLTDVRQVLDNHGIRYAVEEDVISLDGAPEVAVIDLGRAANAEAIQAILDNQRES
jgi:hypothetical protein